LEYFEIGYRLIFLLTLVVVCRTDGNFCVFDNNACYPAYVIHFKVLSHSGGAMPPRPMAFGGFAAAVGRFVPGGF
jgi:hypothetical protein